MDNGKKKVRHQFSARYGKWLRLAWQLALATTALTRSSETSQKSRREWGASPISDPLRWLAAVEAPIIMGDTSLKSTQVMAEMMSGKFGRPARGHP